MKETLGYDLYYLLILYKLCEQNIIETKYLWNSVAKTLFMQIINVLELHNISTKYPAISAATALDILSYEKYFHLQMYILSINWSFMSN